jgi:uncharacterized membrane protein YfcA
LIADPIFYLVAIPAVLLFGISKGGFGGGFGIVTVPAMALLVPPTQAAAIMLPILLAMDVAAVWAYRVSWDRGLVRILLPAGLCGTAIGTLGFSVLSADAIRLLLGAIAIGFVLHRWSPRGRAVAPAPRSVAGGWFWGTISGFTSFIAHAGGPPISVYLLPLRLPPAILVGTVAVLFAALNWSKVLPYWWLGLFSAGNLATSAALAPVGLAGVWIGVWLQKRIDQALFYRLVYGFLLLTGAKLIHDGLRL